MVCATVLLTHPDQHQTLPAQILISMASVEIVEQYPRLVDFVLSDHVHVHVLYKHLVQAMANNESPLISKLSNAIMLLVRQHSQAELDVLYPAMQSDLGPLGQSLAEKALDEHAQVEELVKKALEAGVGSKEAAQLVKDFCDVRRGLKGCPQIHPPTGFFRSRGGGEADGACAGCQGAQRQAGAACGKNDRLQSQRTL